MRIGRLARLFSLPAKFFRAWSKDPEARSRFRVSLVGIGRRFLIAVVLLFIFGAALETLLLCSRIVDPENYVVTFVACSIVFPALVPEALFFVNGDEGWAIPIIVLMALAIAIWPTARHRRIDDHRP